MAHATEEEMRKNYKLEDGEDVSEYYACDACRYETKKITFYELHDRGQTALCDICANTYSASALEYPRQYDGESRTIHTIAYCTNMILDEIRKTNESH